METILETEHLTLRRFEREDAQRLFEMHQDSEVARWIPNERYADPEEAREAAGFFADCVNRVALPYVLAAVLRETGELIGDAGLNGVDGRPGEVEIGFVVAREHRGAGFATELAGAMTGLAFSAFHVATLYGRVMRGNRASARVLEKNGYRFIREETGAEDDPEGRGMWVYGLQSEETGG